MLVACPHCNTTNRIPDERLRERPKVSPMCGRCTQPMFTGQPLVLTRANFDVQLARGELPLIVDFWAPWCGPCLSMAPSFERAAAELEPRLRLAKLDTEAEPAIAARHHIRSIPTLIAFKGGRELARQSGALPLPALLKWAGQFG
ncbi:thioredoxin TrxC [Nevskia sp.]|uniref:thioredoxin TrxC n=1 Tax=Nevskia sp. TaxID=1929292 RepID=UPI0025E9392E|nr:thioredoxin TrxC [Nevskia sp.]